MFQRQYWLSQTQNGEDKMTKSATLLSWKIESIVEC